MNPDNDQQEQTLDKTIIRAAHDKKNPYVMIRRAVPQDKRLSWEARGVMAYLLSKPDDWSIQANDLRQHCGRDKVYSILKELTENGYLERVQWVDETGKFDSFEYRLHETPLTPLPETAEPDTANPHHTYNKDSELNTDSSEPAVQGENPAPLQFPAKSPFTTTYTHPGSPNASKKKRVMGRDGSVVDGYEPSVKVNSALTKPAAAPGRPAIVPKPTPAARERNRVFDKLGEVCFQADTPEKVQAVAGRIGKLQKALRSYLTMELSPADVEIMIGRWEKWYTANHKPGFSKPADPEAFMASWFEGEKVNFGIGQAANADMVDDPDNPGTPIHKDLLAQRLEADAAFKARYGQRE